MPITLKATVRKTVSASEIQPGRTYFCDNDGDTPFVVIGLQTSRAFVVMHSQICAHDDTRALIHKTSVDDDQSIVAVSTDGWVVLKNSTDQFVEIEADLVITKGL